MFNAIQIIIFLIVFPSFLYQHKLQILYTIDNIVGKDLFIDLNYFLIILIWFKNTVIVSKNLLINTSYRRPSC